MKKILTACSIFTLSLCASKADLLPSLKVKNWQSYHVLSKGKYHGIGVDQKGSIDLYFMKRETKTNLNKPVELAIKVERRLKKAGSKWINKQIKKEGFKNSQKALENPKKLSLHGIVTGDVEFKIEFTFTKVGVLMNAEFVGKPKDSEEADYRLSIVSDIEEMYTVKKEDINDEKKIKTKTRGDELSIETRKSKKPVRYRFHEPIEVEKLEKDEIISLKLKCDKFGRKDLFWSLADAKLGSFTIEPKASNKMPYDGFSLSTVLIDETGKKQGAGVLLEYK